MLGAQWLTFDDSNDSLRPMARQRFPKMLPPQESARAHRQHRMALQSAGLIQGSKAAIVQSLGGGQFTPNLPTIRLRAGLLSSGCVAAFFSADSELTSDKSVSGASK